MSSSARSERWARGQGTRFAAGDVVAIGNIVDVEGISHKMLTQNLRMLERNGLVERNVHPTVPPRVDYTLTGPGQALRATIDGMCGWTRQYLAHIETSRRHFDA